jgi:hypothetical protein
MQEEKSVEWNTIFTTIASYFGAAYLKTSVCFQCATFMFGVPTYKCNFAFSDLINLK